jgi:hypothetical protein
MAERSAGRDTRGDSVGARLRRYEWVLGTLLAMFAGAVTAYMSVVGVRDATPWIIMASCDAIIVVWWIDYGRSIYRR